MKDSFDMYPDQVVNLSDQREGHGILLLSESLCVRFIDGRARKLCQEIRGESDQNHADLLPVSTVSQALTRKAITPFPRYSLAITA